MGIISRRRETILKIIVSEYIVSATPVASEGIAHNYNLGISPATIRHEIACLEEEGYITRPHTSAGGMPSDKGYRYYIECSIEGIELSETEQQAIRKFFDQAEQDVEGWVRLAAAVLAQKLKNVALVTLPRATECHLRYLDLIAVQDFLALLIIVLQEARLKQQLLTLDQVMSQDELATIGNKLNAAYKGLTQSQISAKELELSPIENHVREALLQIMRAEDERQNEELYLYGLRHLLSQPEFIKGEKTIGLVEVLEERVMFNSLLSSVSSKMGTKVIIGNENKEQALQRCSVILNSYGIPGIAEGAIGIIGPTRMPYNQVIPTVNYLSSLMSELVSELYA
jgi:heat-inducible transcriptional repressor